MSMRCVVPEMLWSLDELKCALISELPILKTEEGEGFKILYDLFVEWAEILLNYSTTTSIRSVEFGELWPRILLSGDFEEAQRNPDLAQFTDAEAESPAKRIKK